MIDRIERILSSLKPSTGESEQALHGRVARSLIQEGVSFAVEFDLGRRRGRIDFLCEGGIGVEAKVGHHSRGRLISQAKNYLDSEYLQALMIVSERRIPGWLEGPIKVSAAKHGKPLRIIELARGVAS